MEMSVSFHFRVENPWFRVGNKGKRRRRGGKGRKEERSKRGGHAQQTRRARLNSKVLLLVLSKYMRP